MLFPDLEDGARFVNRADPDDVLSSYAGKSFQLEDRIWPTVEHYYQAMKFDDEIYREKIRLTATAAQARKLGHDRKRLLGLSPKPRKDWKERSFVMMTRATYVKCCQHEEVKKALLSTGNQQLIESSQYDYYWGCGRDRRGQNMYGKMMMNVREKLREQQSDDS